MDEVRAQLAELMRSIQKEDKGKGKEFTDFDVCKLYITGVCPHELFENTKHYMGECSKIHSDELREKYLKARKKKRYRYEEEAIRVIQPLVDDSNKKISRGQQRCIEDEKKMESNDDIKKIDEIIQAKMREVEELGSSGNVEESMKAMEILSKLNLEKGKLLEAKAQENATLHRLKPCVVCGALLSTTDSDRRLSEHVSGKIHIGFQRLREALKSHREYISNVAPLLEDYIKSERTRSHDHKDHRRGRSRERHHHEADKDKNRKEKRSTRSREHEKKSKRDRYDRSRSHTPRKGH